MRSAGMPTRRARAATPLGPAQALELATRFLSVRPRSRWEVERRLQRARADDAVVVATIDHLARLGLIEDLAFARWWVDQRDRHAPRGHRLLEAELRQHGVHREVIEQLGDELAADQAEASATRGGEDAAAAEPDPRDEVEGTVTEDDRARIALSRHLRGRPLPSDPRGVQRLGMFLVRRGFDPDTARAAIRSRAESGSALNDADPDVTAEPGRD